MYLMEAFQSNLVDPYYKQFFKTVLCLCDCGHKLSVQKNLKKIYCSNPDCFNAKARRLLNVCNYIGLENWSFEDLKEVVKNVPYDMLLVPAFCEVKSEPYISIAEWLLNKPHTSSELLEMMCIPEFKSNAATVFRNIPSAQYFVEILERHSVEDFIRMQLGKELTESNFKMAITIETYLKEIITVLYKSNLRAVKKTYYIVITDDITRTTGPNRAQISKYEYCDYLNKLGGEYLSVEMTGALTTADYIINDKGFKTEKLVRGLNIEQRKQKKIVIHSDEFVKIFKEGVASYVERKDEFI